MKGRKIVVLGVDYPSIASAAKALGVTRQSASKAVREGRKIEDVLPNRKLLKGDRIACKPIIIRGVEYPSQLIASNILGVAPGTISSALRRGTLPKVGLGIFGRNPKF